MPEIGDTVLIYFPNREEKNGIGMNAIRVSNTGSDKIGNPEVKYLRTADDKEQYLMIYNLTHKTDVKVAAMIDGELQVIFIGVMTKIELEKTENVFCVKVSLKSKSCLLDIEKKRRSFQHDTGMINDIFDRIIEMDHGGQATSFELSGMAQGEAFIQYDETDWQFVQRIASKHKKMLITNVKNHVPAIFIGTHGAFREKVHFAFHTLCASFLTAFCSPLMCGFAAPDH